MFLHCCWCILNTQATHELQRGLELVRESDLLADLINCIAARLQESSLHQVRVGSDLRQFNQRQNIASYWRVDRGGFI